MNSPSKRQTWTTGLVMLSLVLAPLRAEEIGGGQDVRPKHVNDAALLAVRKGLDFLAKNQLADGSFPDQGGQAYPTAVTSLCGMAFLASGSTPTRGRYAKNIRDTTDFLLKCSTRTGLLTGPTQDSGRPMHGHGFALLYLATVYGMEPKEAIREQIQKAVEKGVKLTSQGQSRAGGWTYTPGSGDEGSVTVTQVQALRAAHNGGFLVPKGTVAESVRYLERCSTPDGGIVYSLGSGGGPMYAISCAAVATLYNAGEYDSPLANRCLEWVWNQTKGNPEAALGNGHGFYSMLYASQAFYFAGDKYWDEYFPKTRDILIRRQDGEGAWDGDGIGKPYGTAIALITLQLPYRYLPVYQR
jgi:hypothetical protein